MVVAQTTVLELMKARSPPFIPNPGMSAEGVPPPITEHDCGLTHLLEQENVH